MGMEYFVFWEILLVVIPIHMHIIDSIMNFLLVNFWFLYLKFYFAPAIPCYILNLSLLWIYVLFSLCFVIVLFILLFLHDDSNFNF